VGQTSPDPSGRLLASAPVSTLAGAPERAAEEVPASAQPPRSHGLTADAALGLGLAAALVAVAFLTSGTVDQTVTAPGTWTEIALVLLGAAAIGTVLLVGGPGRVWGGATLALFAAFTAVAGLSIVWSVQPDWSWFGADQLLAYLAAMTAAAAAARVFPERWPAVAGGITGAMVALSAYALLAKVFPATLASGNTYGRLQQPFGYWNAVGVCAALGLPGCLWLGARRDLRGWARGLSVPAMTLLIAAIALSFSRSSILVAVLAAGCFLAVVPLRLRATWMLALAAVCSVPVIVWALGHRGVTSDGVAPALQDSAGHSFGIVLVVVLAIAVAVGVAAGLAADRVGVPPTARRRIGLVLVGLLALVPVAAVVALAASHRGLTGEVSHAWSTLTSSKTTVGDTSSRVTQLGSSRPLYWHQGLDVGAHALLKGAGELGYGLARLRYTTNPAKSDQAHSYVIQTFADLGLIGVALTAALLVAWVIAAGRALARRVAWSELPAGRVAERQGLIVLAAVVFAFGVQSALDWTWYFPGVAVPVLVGAGWLAGRGPLLAPVGRARTRRSLLDRPGTGAIITLIAAVAVGAAWVVWQPLRSVQDLTNAENASSNAVAFADARASASADPFSIEPFLQLSTLYQGLHNRPGARRALVQATQVQPQNADGWIALAQYDLQTSRFAAAIREADHVLALDHTADPNTVNAIATGTQAHDALAQRAARARRRRRHRGGPPAART